MKINKPREKGITMVSLVVTIIVLIILAGVSINMVVGHDGIITIAKRAKENIELAQEEEQSKLNELYMQIEKEDGSLGDINIDFSDKINEFKRKIAEYIEEAGGIKPEPPETAATETFGESILGIVEEVTKNTNATADKIVKDYTAYVKGKLVIGTMKDNGAVNKTLNIGETFTIPEGYHNGTGKVTTVSLESQTPGTATADKILKDYTAYVNGKLVVGTMINRGAVNQMLNAGGSYTIPAGYHNGSGKVTANSLASQTGATATAGEIISGKTAWVNGTKITGTMPNQGAKTATINAGQTYTIPAGYHNGAGKITAASLASQTGGTAVIKNQINKCTTRSGLTVPVAQTILVHHYSFYQGTNNNNIMKFTVKVNGTTFKTKSETGINSLINVNYFIECNAGDTITFSHSGSSGRETLIAYFDPNA